MSKIVGGFSKDDLHGSTSSLGGNLGERVHGVHSGTPAAETGGGEGTGGSKPGGVYSKQNYEDDQAQSRKTDQHNVSTMRSDNAAIDQQAGMSNEETNRDVNDKTYQMAEGGSASAQSRFQDTDALIANIRGDEPGTEYAENPQTGGSPIAINKSQKPSGGSNR